MSSQTIINLLFSEFERYSEAEKKIASYIINNPREVINMTIAELSKSCKTSEASISRFCKKFTGSTFHHLKIRLAREQVENNQYIQVSNDISVKDVSQSLKNILANKIDELTATVNMIDEKEFAQIIELIKKAKSVQVMAVGNTIPVALDCAFKFNELGIKTVAGSIWETQAAYSLSLGKDDVLIAISNSGESSKVYSVVESANSRNVTTIGITNNKNSAIGKISKYHIQTATREKLFLDEFCFSRISASTVVEIIYLFLTNEIRGSYSRISRAEEFYADEKL